MLYAMSEDNILPPIFKKVNDKTQAQEFGLTFFFLIAVVTLFLSSAFDEIMHYTMFIDSGSLIFAGATIFVLRKRMKGSDYNGFKVKLFPFVPMLFMAVLLVVCVSDFVKYSLAVWISLGVMAAGFPLYHLLKRKPDNTAPNP
jgi:APA family basic amino acid/polyamine antiporter